MQQYVSNPQVTMNIVTRNQTLGLEDRRALIVGQRDPGRRASGSITFSVNPSADDTITLNGTAWTFKASGATGNQVNLGASLALTMAALKTALNASAETQTAKCTYEVNSTKLFITFDARGTTGNAFTLAASAATVSASTLEGGAAADGVVTSGTLQVDVGRTPAEINDLFGAGSHAAMVARAYRGVNAYTNLDVMPLADDAGATYATAKATVSGTALRDGTAIFRIVSAEKHTYEVSISTGDTPDDIVARLAAAIALDRYQPFTTFTDEATYVEFTAVNGGTHANSWLIAAECAVPGITIALTGWSGGGTNPSLTGVFDQMENIRYQTIVWPEVYSTATLKAFIDPRKNVDNNVMDGRAFRFKSSALATVKSESAGINSSEIVTMWNEPTSQTGGTQRWVGPHLPDCPDVLAAKFAAARDRRFEDDVSISDIVATNEPDDQFGGIDLASLPYFNTPLLGVQSPLKGTGATFAEQLEAEDAGVTVVGVNRSLNGVVMGTVVTTWLNDVAGNPDDTWKYLEWRDTHGVIREFIVNNVRKRFAQYRLTNGDTIPNRAMANAPMIEAYILDLCMQLANKSLIEKGQESRQFIQDNMTVTLTLAQRKAQVALKFRMVSQLGVITGTLQFEFSATG